MKELKCKLNKNLIFRGVPTMNDGEIQIFVNNRHLCYVDLDNFGFCYDETNNSKFKDICDLICYDLFHGSELYDFNEFANEMGLREIKENY